MQFSLNSGCIYKILAVPLLKRTKKKKKRMNNNDKNMNH